MHDAAQLDDFVSLPTLLKARPHEEGNRRFLFIEASSEGQKVDYEGEIVLQKALEESSAYYLRHGNVDLDHLTIVGPKRGMTDYASYEVGKPIQVSMHGKSTFVKAELYKGSSPMARNATIVWDSLTKQTPAARWYASVGGAVLGASKRTDPLTKSEVRFIEKVRWNNLALTRTPMHPDVPEVSISPIGGLAKSDQVPICVFSKSLNGWCTKTLTAGYGTDLLAGVASYLDFREKLAKSMLAGAAGKNPGARELVEHCVRYGLSLSQSAEYVKRFLADIGSNLKRK